MSDAAGRLWEVIEPYVAAEGIELDDLEVVGGGNVSIVRVTVDAEEPIDVDRIARLSRAVSRMLDDADPFPGSYTLEVSSPGLERKLRRPRHFAKSVGRDVKVKTRREIDGERVHRGVITSAGEEDFTFSNVDGDHVMAYDEIATAQTTFVWETTAKPGSAKH